MPNVSSNAAAGGSIHVVRSGSIHVVRKGDTLSGIAKQHGVTVEALKRANPAIKNANAISLGQKITIPGPPPAQASITAPPAPVGPATYTVAPGDTLAKIGAQQGVDWEAIAQLNNIKKPFVLQVGQVLRLRAGAAQPATAAPTPPAAAPAAPAAPAGPTADGLSPRGVKFLFDHEAQRGVSDRPHWPKGASGVTIGPGYDLKHRTAADIVRDCTAIGMHAPIAARLAKGAGLKGAEAKAFCAANLDIRVTPEQEQALLAKAIGPYAKAVRDAVRVPLTQNQFDALVSFVYNIGAPSFAGSTTLKKLNRGDYAGAADAMTLWNKSGGKKMQGLVNRRADEVAFFKDG